MIHAFVRRFERPLSLLLLALTSPVLQAEGDAPPPHLAAAEDLVQRLELAHTDYHHQSFDVSWEAVPHCYADCSGFLDALLMHAYGLKRDDFQRWIGSRRPNAAAYYEAIRANRGFQTVATIQTMRPGDILAIFYRNRTDNSGHILLADGLPEVMPPKKPLVEGLQQWLLPVIDCSESGHGPQDSRHKKGPDGKDHAGLGRGYLRIYSDQSGHVQGFTWSTLNLSLYKGSDEEPLIVGRFDPAFRP